MLRFKNTTVSYGKTEILKNISFSLKQGKFTALIGKNGSGKSTLLSAAAGLLSFDGEIFLKGRPLKGYSSKELAQLRALLPQLLPNASLTVERLAAMGRTPYLDLTGRLKAEDREQVETAMEQTDVLRLRDRFLSELSGGERQRAYLAMVLAQNAELLLLDEPTAFMDVEVTRSFLKLLRRLQKEQHKTVLTVFHDLNAAMDYADELLLLENGRLCFSGSAEACRQSGLVEEVFGVTRKTREIYQ
ncbi:MAG: ABC transporter ATP-binding protein [Clostridia bacterium]|nr:ABC transporter ATP-binding protein [Clostridia bacterium]